MNLSRVVNWSDPSLTPMGGSASFYSMIQPCENNMTAQLLAPYTGGQVTALFMKILIHEVYEVRNPDYSKIPSAMLTTAAGLEISVPMNPAIVSISGSITPWFDGDMRTASICRVLTTPTVKFPIDTSNMQAPAPVGRGNQPLSIPKTVFLGTALLKINDKKDLISLDVSNMCNEYGVGFGNTASFAGNGDVPPFTSFSNYNYGNISLMYQPDSGGSPMLVGTITYDRDYNMNRFIETGGMIDLQVSPMDYSQGYFYLMINGIGALTENSVFITTDQQGIYAEQGQAPGNEYLSDGLPRGPFMLRVFYRAAPVSRMEPKKITLQNINVPTGVFMDANYITVYDSMWFIFPTDKDGCFTYSFAVNPSQQFPLPNANGLDAITYFAMQSYLVVLRVLSDEKQLLPYLAGQLPITWDVVFKQVLQLYKTIYPVMDKVLPINEQNWSEPIIQDNILLLTSELNWQKPNYMPVTRDTSRPQRELIEMWVNQNKKPKIV
jgi:hypothetical protein